MKPKIEINNMGRECITYAGLDMTKKWVRIESYGPKFVENAIQSISRDLLADTLRRLSDAFICGHVHDEIIVETPPDLSVDEICTKMGETPEWIRGLLLKADGYSCEFYQKD